MKIAKITLELVVVFTISVCVLWTCQSVIKKNENRSCYNELNRCNEAIGDNKDNQNKCFEIYSKCVK